MKTRLVILVVTILCAGWTLHAFSVVEPAVARPLAAMPLALGPWTGQTEAGLDAETLSVLRVDDYIMRRYRRRSEAVELYVGYYASQRQGGTMHSPLNCLPGAGWESISSRREPISDGNGTAFDVNRYLVQKGLDKRMVLYWYQSHGRAVASEYWSRAYLVLDSLRLHRSDGALVRVVTDPIQDEDRAEHAATDFVRALAPALLHILPR